MYNLSEYLIEQTVTEAPVTRTCGKYMQYIDVLANQ